ncbi:MAG: DUF4126 domain-containing protein [Rhodocyclaceae bacterium]
MNWTHLDLTHLVALAAALGFASGIRLYALVFVLGAAGHFGWIDLPSGLQVLTHPIVMGVAAFLAVVEFLADKIPAVDTVWDSIHTFIRLPAGAALAAGLTGNGAAATVAMALLGGTFAATGHLAKTGTRATLNTSPEPVSNWTASFGEDVVSLGLFWLIAHHPLVAGALALVLAAICVWIVRRLWRSLRRLLRSAGTLARSNPDPDRHVT